MNSVSCEELLDRLEDDAMDGYDRRESELGADMVRDLERWVLLQLIDVDWREHLLNMDYLREGIHLRALGQKDPLSEYRLEGHQMFVFRKRNEGTWRRMVMIGHQIRGT